MWWRSALAVIAGYAVMVGVVVGAFVVLVGDPLTPPGRAAMIGLLAGGLVAALLGGYVAAWVAGRAPLAHALVLVGIAVGMWIVSFLVGTGGEPLAFKIGNLLVLVVGGSVGGWLRAQQTGA